MKTKTDILNDLSKRNSHLIVDDRKHFYNLLENAVEAGDFKAIACGLFAKTFLELPEFSDEIRDKKLDALTVGIYSLIAMFLETEQIYKDQIKIEEDSKS